jgi:KDO2-lipid IV(A) lauroyltransferase
LWLASRALRLLGQTRYVFADVLGLALYARAGSSAQRCAANHRRLDPTLDAASARRRARGSYREFMRTSFDFVWEYAMTPARMQRHFRVEGLQGARAALDEHNGAVIALAHFGNWDVAATIAVACELPITAVMSRVGESALATRIAVWARRHRDIEILLTGGGAGHGMMRAVHEHRFAAILADIPDRGNRVEVDFCGGRVNFSTSPVWIARTAGVPIMCVDCWREDGRYRMVFHPAFMVGEGDSDADVMQRVASTVEQQIRRTPTQWYPFGRVYRD